MKPLVYIIAVIAFFGFTSFTRPAADYSYQIALLKYNGGGDWYANLETSLPNLIKFCNEQLHTSINPEQAIVDAVNKC